MPGAALVIFLNNSLFAIITVFLGIGTVLLVYRFKARGFSPKKRELLLALSFSPLFGLGLLLKTAYALELSYGTSFFTTPFTVLELTAQLIAVAFATLTVINAMPLGAGDIEKMSRRRPRQRSTVAVLSIMLLLFALAALIETRLIAI